MYLDFTDHQALTATIITESAAASDIRYSFLTSYFPFSFLLSFDILFVHHASSSAKLGSEDLTIRKRKETEDKEEEEASPY